MAKIPKIAPLVEQPRYVAAIAKQNNLSGALVKIETRTREVEMQLGAHISEEDHTQGHVDAALEFASTGIVRQTSRFADLREEHLALREQASALRKVAASSAEEVHAVARELSHAAVAAIEAEHQDLRGRYVAKLRELDALHGEEEAMVHALCRLGYDPHLPFFVQWLALGRIDEAGSLIGDRVREFSQ